MKGQVLRISQGQGQTEMTSLLREIIVQWRDKQQKVSKYIKLRGVIKKTNRAKKRLEGGQDVKLVKGRKNGVSLGTGEEMRLEISRREGSVL